MDRKQFLCRFTFSLCETWCSLSKFSLTSTMWAHEQAQCNLVVGQWKWSEMSRSSAVHWALWAWFLAFERIAQLSVHDHRITYTHFFSLVNGQHQRQLNLLHGMNSAVRLNAIDLINLIADSATTHHIFPFIHLESAISFFLHKYHFLRLCVFLFPNEKKVAIP